MPTNPPIPDLDNEGQVPQGTPNPLLPSTAGTPLPQTPETPPPYNNPSQDGLTRAERLERRRQRIAAFFAQVIPPHITPPNNMALQINITPLKKHNYKLWYAMIKNAAVLVGAEQHIEQNVQLPQDADEATRTAHRKQMAQEALLIHQSISQEVLKMLGEGYLDDTPHQLIKALEKATSQDDPMTRTQLKAEAENLQYTDDITLEEYVQKHREIRYRMMSAQYHDIQEESTTVDFIFKGIANHPEYHPYVTALMMTPPPTIKATLCSLQKARGNFTNSEANAAGTQHQLSKIQAQPNKMERANRRIQPHQRRRHTNLDQNK